MSTELVKFIRTLDGRNTRIGVILAKSKTEIGWSLLHDEDLKSDKSGEILPSSFNKEEGLRIARERADKGLEANIRYIERIFNSKVKKPTKLFDKIFKDLYYNRERNKYFDYLNQVYKELFKMKDRAISYYK